MIVAGFFSPDDILDPTVASLWRKVRDGEGTVGELMEIERLLGLSLWRAWLG